MTTADQYPNANCLEGMRCPECGSYGPFAIELKTMALVYDDGTKDVFGDQEWDNDSHCRCDKCDDYGPVSNFRGAAKPDTPGENPEDGDREETDVQEALADELLSWCIANEKPHLSVDELMREQVTAGQMVWLLDFNKRWGRVSE